jgi:hypothetical protein
MEGGTTNMPRETKAMEEIKDLLQKINEAWSKGNPDDLAEFFHENLVILGPDLQRMGEGKEACIQSYKDFLTQAVIHMYKEHDFLIDVWGNTAVAIYTFDISYGMSGLVFNETGHDMFVFNRREGKWLAVWRMVFPTRSEK